MRNAEMVERIERAPAEGDLRFVVAGDSGAWPDPTADAIFSALIERVRALDPQPLFFANLGDFAGPGTPDRHERYLRLVDGLNVPDICVVGNHDLDDERGLETFERVHGPPNYTFGLGHTRFVVLNAAPGEVGVVETDGAEGPSEEALAFLEGSLAGADEPNRVVLMHMPPYLDGHYAPHADWGFREREREFLGLLCKHRISLVCCAHGLAFDTHVRDGVRFVMSGGGGTGLCSHYPGVCTAGFGRPEDRGSIFHAVELRIAASGDVTGRVLQAFGEEGSARFEFP